MSEQIVSAEAALSEIRREARIVLERFLDPALSTGRMAMARALQPLPGDYERVFLADVAEHAREGYAALWDNMPVWPVRPEQTELAIAVAYSEDFAENSERAQAFPGGYRSVAHHLRPGVIWVCWEFIAPGRDAGVSFDGLVRIDGRWAWFPKPWKVLPSTPKASPLSHFSE